MSDFYTFRFGTYGSNNPLFYSKKTEGVYTQTNHPWDLVVNPNPNINTIGISPSKFGIDQIRSLFHSPSNKESLEYQKSDSTPKSFKVNFASVDIAQFSNLFALEFIVKCNVTPTRDVISGESKGLLSAEMYLKIGYRNKESSIIGVASDTSERPMSEQESAHILKLKFSSDFLAKNDLLYMEYGIVFNKGSDYTWVDPPLVLLNGFEINEIREDVPGVVDDTYAIGTDEDGKKHKVYLCPWELKHVDSISIGVSGNTSTMGLPGKPASKTQIFDTEGAIRTFKITGRRYDWEEEISNWDFLNTQYNFAVDSVAGKSPDEDGYYCYIGLSWLLSNIQVLLKGYYLYIGRNDEDDHRFVGYTPTAKVATRGYNVALTGLNTSFSESEPGLLNYTITLTERFKYGNSLYMPYNSEYTKIGE